VAKNLLEIEHQMRLRPQKIMSEMTKMKK